MLNIVCLIKNFSKSLWRKQRFPHEFRILFSNSPFIIQVFDLEGLIIYHNHKSNIDELKADYNILTDEKILNSEIHPYILKAIKGETSIIQSKKYYSDYFPWYLPDLFYEISLYPLQDIEGETIFIAIIHHEINNESNNPNKQIDIIREIENSVAHSFLTNISHELRTPLNWILGFSELISRERNVEKIHEYNNTINRGGVMLLKQIEKLIDNAWVAKNTIEVELTDFDINQLLLEVFRLMQNEVLYLGKQIAVSISSELTENQSMISSDRIKLKQILLNLAHNSIKFTKEGYIEIGVEMVKENEFVFTVRDTGIGIDPVKQKYITELLSKSESKNFHEEYGLGLIVVNRYVINLGGKLWFESQTDVGTTVYFTIKDMKMELKTEVQYEAY
jgi:signal transduction histidine kinase